MDWQHLERFSFGDSPALADDLLALVLAGKKTATCHAAAGGPLTRVGERAVACDGVGQPRAVIETTEYALRRFDQVDAVLAHDEGEGDLSLGFWRAAHERYFRRLGQFAPDMLVYCERFRLVKVLGSR
jgi:uncharacterized protein YhfF